MFLSRAARSCTRFSVRFSSSSSSPELRGLAHLIHGFTLVGANGVSGQPQEHIFKAGFFDLNGFDPAGELRNQSRNEFGSTIHLKMNLAADLLSVDVVGTLQIIKKRFVAAHDDLVAADHMLQVYGRVHCLDLSMI